MHFVNSVFAVSVSKNILAFYLYVCQMFFRITNFYLAIGMTIFLLCIQDIKKTLPVRNSVPAAVPYDYIIDVSCHRQPIHRE